MKQLLNWFRRRNLESGLDRELNYHIDRRVTDLVRSGLPEWEARRRATLELGGLAQVREEVRDVWLTRWLRDFAYDLRFSARSFLRTPTFTATALLSLALGIGATTAIYSLVDQILLHALPVRQPERLVLIDWVRGTPEGAFQAMRTILRNADPALPVTYFRTLDEQVNRSLNTERLLAALSGSFGTLALLLSLVGLYGVMSFVVTQRTREIGIRLALGATRFATVWLVLRDALVMIAAGIAIALPCVWALGRLVELQLYDVKPTDPVAIAAATLVLCATALGAALIPARRASAVNPTEALRFE
jgi:hypothetical protein